MENNEKDNLISTVNKKTKEYMFKSTSLEHLEMVKSDKKEFISKNEAIEDYHKNSSIQNIQKNIIKLSEDEYNLSYVIEMEAIKNIEERIENGYLNINDLKIFGNCENSIKNLMNSMIIEKSIGLINDFQQKAKIDGISHIVNEPLDNISQSIRNKNFALISRIVYKDTVELINPPYNMLFEDISRTLQKGRADSISDLQKASDNGLEVSVVDGLIEKSFAFERLNLLKDKMELFEIGSIPLIRPMLVELRKDFEASVKLITENSQKVKVSQNKLKI